MARPERNNVDYFPFLCKEGKAMYYVEQKYGNDGYAAWVKILRQLAITNHHFLNLSDKVELMFLSSKCRVSEEVLINLLNDLCEMGEFNKGLWLENRILWSDKFIDSIKDAYLKRNNKCINLDGLLFLLNSLGIRKLGKGELKAPDNTQRREEKSKEEKSKERDSVFENSILSFFGFSETANFNHARTVNAFVSVITDQGRLEYFKTQFSAYCKYKDKAGYPHSLKNFIGEQKDRFENGQWDSENWTEKLKSLPPETTEPGSRPVYTGFILGQKPMGAVNHAK